MSQLKEIRDNIAKLSLNKKVDPSHLRELVKHLDEILTCSDQNSYAGDEQ